MKVFVYGSLMNISELEKVFPDFGTVVLAELDGYVRDFSKASWSWGEDEDEDVGVLSIREMEDEWCNGLLVGGVSEEAFEKYVEREGGYTVEELPTENISLYLDRKLPSDSTIYTVVRSPERVLPPENGIDDTYKKLCFDAAKEFGDEFYVDFVATTYQYYNE